MPPGLGPETSLTDFIADGFENSHSVAPFHVQPRAFPLAELDDSDAHVADILGDSHRVYQAIAFTDNPGCSEFNLFTRVAKNQTDVSPFSHTNAPECFPHYFIVNHVRVLLSYSFDCYFLLTLAINRLLSIKFKYKERLAKISKI